MNESEIKRIVQSTVNRIKGTEKMTLSLAEQLCEKVIERARSIGVKAVVCISDDAGNPRLVKCMDDAYIASYDVAVNKAFTVVALKMSTKALKKLAQPGESLYGIQFTNGGRIIIFGGGDPLESKGGAIIGGLGVSGGSEAQDTALSEFGKRYFEQNLRF